MARKSTQPSKTASKMAIRLFLIAVISSFLSIILFHHTFQDKWTVTEDDSMLAPHLRSSYTKIDKDGLSACLLVNDENPRLPEWIAYHYHVLPLRSLIVAVDPVSKHQPDEILLRWPQMGVEVDIWNDTYYLGNQGGVCTYNDAEKCLLRHRWRQTTFMSRCMSEFKQRNKTWVLLIDVDEYISSDHLDWEEDSWASYFANNLTIDKHKTIRDILTSHEPLDPCHTFTRQLYGAKEDFNVSIWKDMAPLGFDDTDFVTLRYRWRALKDKVFVNRWQKTIIDVSRIPINDLRQQVFTVHLPYQKHCEKDPKKFRTTLLRANHYIDSFQSYSYRKDARSHEKENYMKWEVKSKDAVDEMDMDLTQWLKGFVKSVGREKAKKLLADTGKFFDKEF